VSIFSFIKYLKPIWQGIKKETQMKNKFLKGLLASFILVVSGFASAGLILEADSASAPTSNGTALPINLINQSGLSATYTSGVTDFNTFMSSTTHDSDCGDNCWANVPNVIFPINLDFSLGGVFNIEGLGLWNYSDTLGLNQFELFAANDSSFTGAISLGVFNANVEPSPSSASGQIFSFASTQASHVRIKINSNYGSTSQVAIGEIVFEQSVNEVPEPSTLAVFTLALMGLASRKFKKKA
jgi:hypothetical protein